MPCDYAGLEERGEQIRLFVLHQEDFRFSFVAAGHLFLGIIPSHCLNHGVPSKHPRGYCVTWLSQDIIRHCMPEESLNGILARAQ